MKYKIKYLQGGATDQPIDTKGLLFDYSPLINRNKWCFELHYLIRILGELKIPYEDSNLLNMQTALCDLEYLLRNPCKILMSQNISTVDGKTANGGLTNLQLWNIMEKIGEDQNDQVIIEELKYIHFYITKGAPSGTLYGNHLDGDKWKRSVSLIYHSERLEKLSTEMKKYLPEDLSSLNFMLQTTADWYRDRPIDEDRIIAILHGSTVQCKNDQGGFLYNPENEYLDDKSKQAYKNYLDIYYKI